MLTTEPGPDVAAYHIRQVAVLRPDAWKPWLDYSAAAAELLKPLPTNSLSATLAPREATATLL
jgi:putative SOS response-associated peptidase YedK